MIKFLPSYVGSKAWWVKHLQEYSGRHFVEAFCGSSVLSANLASETVLIDSDPFVCKILQNFPEQIVPQEFSADDYFKVRQQEDWWKYAFCLQKMSFSGVFRYSKNGFNVPIKHRNTILVREDYEQALERWNLIHPLVINGDYTECLSYVTPESVLILDPPYESSKTSYTKNTFDYHVYWQFIHDNEAACKTIIVFDSVENLPFSNTKTRTMRVNGKHKKGTEGMFIFENSLRAGQVGESIFLEKFGNILERMDGRVHDFKIINSSKTLELKSDYYDMNKTPNFFIERYSYDSKPGGPWRSLQDSVDYFCYFFVKNNIAFLFNTKELVNALETLIVEKNLTLIDIPNKGYTTRGYKINREWLSSICKTKVLE